MIELSISVSGDREVIARLDRMTDVIRDRLKAAFDVESPALRDAAQARAPVSTGRRSATSKKYGPGRASIKSVVRQRGDSVSMRVGPPAFYMILIEKGVAPKTILVTRRGKLGRAVAGLRARTTKTGKVIFGRRMAVVGKGKGATYTRTHHVTAHPFMRPAFDSMRSRIMDSIAKAVAAGTK